MTSPISESRGTYTTVRASAALPAAGAYDSAPTAIDVRRGDTLRLFCTYTRGASGGAFKLKVTDSADNVTYYDRTLTDGSSFSSGVVNVFTQEVQFPVASGAGAERRSFAFVVENDGYVKISAAEYGVTGTPGTLAITCAERLSS